MIDDRGPLSISEIDPKAGLEFAPSMLERGLCPSPKPRLGSADPENNGENHGDIMKKTRQITADFT